MLDVLILVVEITEKSETTTTIDWLNWDENMRMIIEFDFRTCFFVEEKNDSRTDRFVDISEVKRDDSSRFFLIQMINETR